jgi:hypothetical protein
VSLINGGNYAMYVKSNVDIHTQNKKDKIIGYYWHNRWNQQSVINPTQKLSIAYEIHILPTFNSNLGTENKRFFIGIYYDISTDEEMMEFVTKQISPYFTRGNIKQKSTSIFSIEYPFICEWNSQGFNCNIN